MDRVVVLAGGTGSVKLARALYRLKMDKNSNYDSKIHDIHLSIVCNVGDNIWMHGLYICPDLDTIMYGLGGVLDRRRGWGLIDDTFNCLAQLARLGGEHWFMLGDKDMATHIIRSMMLREGKRLCEVTDHLCSRLGIDARVIPASDDHVETRIITDSGDMHLQEFWVKHKGMPDVKSIVYRGIDDARVCDDAINAIEEADKIIIAPGNPVSSILPILSLRGLRDAMMRVRERCTAVSPIIGKDPVSGPAAKYMRALGYDISPVSVAEMYRGVISKLVIHNTDLEYMDAIRAKGIDVYATDIIMDDEHDEARLASYLLRL